MNVVYSTDDNYAQHVGVSLISLFENNKEFRGINVYVIQSNLSLENIMKLNDICNKYNRNLHFLELDKYIHKLKLNIGNSISVSSYARLFLASMLNENINKVLYFDCDTVINNNLSSLWNIDLGEKLVAGVLDTVDDDTKFKVDMDSEDPYINAGMLLVNLKKWRENRIEDKFINFINIKKGKVFHHDQGVINSVLKKDIIILSPKFNAMSVIYTMTGEELRKYYKLKEYYSEEDLEIAVKDPVFIHYTPAFVNRPWVKGSKHPLKNIYLGYLKSSPWSNAKLRTDKRSFGERLVAFLFNHLAFKLANGLRNVLFK